MRYVAFLRAINVTNRFVKMDVLRRSFVGLDALANIETYIQTGNVLFDADHASLGAPDGRIVLEGLIEAHLQQQLGFPVPTFVRSAAEMAEIARQWPFTADSAPAAAAAGAAVYVAFLRAAPEPALHARLEALSTGVDVLRVFRSQVFWLYYRGRGKSNVTYTIIEKALQAEATVRNISTVRKLAVRLAAAH